MPKTRAQLVINSKPAIDVGTTADSPSIVVDFAPPALPQPLAPSNLQLTTATEFSTASPSARVTATWDAPPGVQVRSYIAQISESNTFPAVGTLTLFARGDEESIDFSGRRPGITQYVRVAAVAQTQGPYTAAASIAAALDTTPAAQPTALAGAWVGVGDLLLTWTNPDITTSKNFRDVELKIFASNGGAQLGPTIYSATGRYVFTAAMNLQYTSGVGDPSLYIEARSRTWSNVVNNTSVPTLSTTKSAPTAPTVAHSWSGETDHAGVAAADLTFVFTLGSDVAKVQLALNAQTARDVLGTVYTYPHSRNVADNGGVGDPTLSYSAIAVDGLGQASTATTGTATNEDPPTPTATLVGGAISLLVATAGGTLASDFERYEFVFKRDTVAVATREQAEAVAHYEMSGTDDSGLHDWAVTIRQKDRFGQFSNATTSSTVSVDALTIASIRADCTYTDSDGNTATTLNALKDANTSSGGVTYNP